MKQLLFLLIFLFALVSCNNNKPKTTYYEYANTKKIMDQTAFNRMKADFMNIMRSQKAHTSLDVIYKDSLVSGDSIIKTFEFKVNYNAINENKNPDVIFNYVNRKLPPHSFTSMNGKKVNLPPSNGRPTLINFWFTTCHPCIDEIPVLNKIREKYKGKINFISITYNTKAEVTKFLKIHPYHFTTIAHAGDYIKELKIISFPVNVFIDKNGVIKKVENGIPYVLKNNKMVMGNGYDFEKYLNSLL